MRAPNKNATKIRIIEGNPFKDCSFCKQILPVIEFEKDTHLRSGYRSQCRKCLNTAREPARKKYYKANEDRLKEASKRYCSKNKEHRRLQSRIWVSKNIEKCIEYRKIYNSNNRPKARNYFNSRYRSDPNFKIRHNVAVRIRDAIFERKGEKSASTLELVDCSIAQLKAHLESAFKPGMTWKNHGFGDDKWHIDHIRPCSSFDLTDPEQQKLCFHWTNLQPLWQADNLAKSDSF